MKIHLIFDLYIIVIYMYGTISYSDQIIVSCSHVLYKESENSDL
jgi:hypothetical protein